MDIYNIISDLRGKLEQNTGKQLQQALTALEHGQTHKVGSNINNAKLSLSAIRALERVRIED